MIIRKNKSPSFGEFVKVFRMAKELSQSEFAEILGISKQRVSDIERNRFNVSVKLAKIIAKKLAVPPDWAVKLALQDMLKKEGIKLKVV